MKHRYSFRARPRSEPQFVAHSGRPGARRGAGRRQRRGSAAIWLASKGLAGNGKAVDVSVVALERAAIHAAAAGDAIAARISWWGP
jgi:hypothetical protein